jgi:hypothetical protein
MEGASRRLVAQEIALSHRGERSLHDVGDSMGMGLEELLASRRGSSGARTARTYDEYLQYREEFGKKVVRQPRVSVSLQPPSVCADSPKANGPLRCSPADTETLPCVGCCAFAGRPTALARCLSSTF